MNRRTDHGTGSKGVRTILGEVSEGSSAKNSSDPFFIATPIVEVKNMNRFRAVERRGV